MTNNVPMPITVALANVRRAQAQYPSTETERDALRRLADVVRAELDAPADAGELAADAEREARTMAPPVPGVTQHNGYAVRAVVTTTGRETAWFIAAQGGPGFDQRWATWRAEQDSTSHLYLSGSHYFDAPGLDNRAAALADLAERAGIVTPAQGYTREQVSAALNQAADETQPIIHGEFENEDSIRLDSVTDLMVNVTAQFLEHPGWTVEQAIAAGWADLEPDFESLSWDEEADEEADECADCVPGPERGTPAYDAAIVATVKGWF